jgi:hypothetical protein
MGERFFAVGRIAWLIGMALLVMIANVAGTVLYMVVYGHFIDPGHEQAYYDAHVEAAAPYCSIIAGIPLMFFAGWFAGGWWRGEFALRSALAIWLIYALIDLAIILAVGATSRMTVLVAVSLLTKLAAVYFGAALAGRRTAG